MSDIELVIKIPEDVFKRTVFYREFRDLHDCVTTIKALESGTPLPKGHGRLGDLDALEKLCIEHEIGNSAFDNSPIIEQGHYSNGDCIWKPLFDFASTIIEADTESEG